MSTVRQRVAATSIACLICAGTVAPYAMASPADRVALPGSSAVWESGTATGANGVLQQWLDDSTGPTAIVIVTPGTDDKGLQQRINRLVGDRESAIVKYPESIFPIIAGKSTDGFGLPIFAPTYQASAQIAEDNNLAIMRALKGHTGPVIYTGFSQGSEALGAAAERANGEGLLDANSVVVLVSDPRSPWGIKGWGKDLPLSDLWVTPLLGAVGVDNNGARDPKNTGDAKVVAVIVQGDPIADWQWNNLRPVSSLLVNGAGFIAIHGQGDGAYGHLDGSKNAKGVVLITNAGNPDTLTSVDGNTTYQVYDTYHPLAMLSAMIYDSLGLKYSQADLEEWDKQATAFYPMQDVANRAPNNGVRVNRAPTAPSADAPTAVSALAADDDAEPAAEAVGDTAGNRRHLLDDNGEWAAPRAGGKHRKAQHQRSGDQSIQATTPAAQAQDGQAQDGQAQDEQVQAPADQSTSDNSVDPVVRPEAPAPADTPSSPDTTATSSTSSSSALDALK